MFDINRMGSALLSRFDLVFILLDKPDEVKDCIIQFIRIIQISIFIIMIHVGSKSLRKMHLVFMYPSGACKICKRKIS